MPRSVTLTPAGRFATSPAIIPPRESRRDRNHLERRFGDKDAEDDVVADMQPVAVVDHEFRRRFESDQDCVEQDQSDHERLEPARLDD